MPQHFRLRKVSKPERTKISNELHDSPAVGLSATIIAGFVMTESTVRSNHSTVGKPHIRKIRNIRRVAGKYHQSTRTILGRVGPPVVRVSPGVNLGNNQISDNLESITQRENQNQFIGISINGASRMGGGQ